MFNPAAVSLSARLSAVRGFFALLLFICSMPLCAAATLYVSPIGSDDNSGAIGAPYKTIQAAVNNASSGDTIYLAYAIYQGNGNRDIDFAGKSLSIISQSGTGKAIIDCQGTQQEPHYAFNFHSNESNVLLDGLTIKNGNEPPTSNDQSAIKIGQGCTVRLTHCGFRDNYTGCIDNHGTTVLTACLFLSNPSTCFNNRGPATFTDCTFTGNSSYCISNSGSATLTNCKFTANPGGGVSNNGDVTLNHCSFTSNVCKDRLGVFVNITGVAALNGCTFSNDVSKAYNVMGVSTGGGIDNFATMQATDCIVTGNTGYAGGGVWNDQTLTITNCIIANNTATDGNGGGIRNKGTATIRFCSIAGNVVKSVSDGTVTQGGGLENDGTATLTNDVIWGNSATNSAEIGTNGGQTTTVTYCDIQGGLSGTGNIKTNPGFVDAANGNLHLQAGSPCRGAGITIGPAKADPNQYNSKPDPGVSTDADGRHRPNPPSMGAYEYTANPPPAKKKPLLDVGSADTLNPSDNVTPADSAASVPGTSVAPTPNAAAVPAAAPQARPALGPAEQKQANDEFLHLMVSLDTNTLSHDEMTRQIQGELAKGAQLDARDGEGFPAIVTAASLKRTDVVQVLLELGADPNALTVHVNSADANANDDSSILHKTANGYQVNVGAVVASIFGHKSKPKPAYGQSALMFAAQNGLADMATLLINAKIVVNMRDSQGKSALDYANQNHHDDVAQLLKDHGAA